MLDVLYNVYTKTFHFSKIKIYNENEIFFPGQILYFSPKYSTAVIMDCFDSELFIVCGVVHVLYVSMWVFFMNTI